LKLIYTIGYQRLTSRRLEKIVGDLDAILVDCRYRPFSQRPEFSGDRLAEQYGARYQQRGHELGGHGHTTVDGIDRHTPMNITPPPLVASVESYTRI
jgi:hypothetical protein